jgi:hypothetical protein
MAHPNWSRKLPRPIVIPKVMKLATLGDVRSLIAKHLPAAHRKRHAWQHVAAELNKAAAGGDAADVAVALRSRCRLRVSSAGRSEKQRERGHMNLIQWIVAAGTAIFVAIVGYFQWRTAQQRSALDLFDRRYEIFQVVREAVAQITRSSPGFDQRREIEFLEATERAYFFFGDEVQDYLEELWQDIVNVRTVDTELPDSDPQERKTLIERRRAAFDRIMQFRSKGRPLFGRYMRFSQTVTGDLIARIRGYTTEV